MNYGMCALPHTITNYLKHFKGICNMDLLLLDNNMGVWFWRQGLPWFMLDLNCIESKLTLKVLVLLSPPPKSRDYRCPPHLAKSYHTKQSRWQREARLAKHLLHQPEVPSLNPGTFKVEGENQLHQFSVSLHVPWHMQPPHTPHT